MTADVQRTWKTFRGHTNFGRQDNWSFSHNVIKFVKIWVPRKGLVRPPPPYHQEKKKEESGHIWQPRLGTMGRGESNLIVNVPTLLVNKFLLLWGGRRWGIHGSWTIMPKIMPNQKLAQLDFGCWTYGICSTAKLTDFQDGVCTETRKVPSSTQRPLTWEWWRQTAVRILTSPQCSELAPSPGMHKTDV